MYERFTDRARRVMQLANQEAQRFNHEYIGTEHILLGLVKVENGVACGVLTNHGLTLKDVRSEIEKLIQSGPEMITMGRLPQTPRAKKVLENAIKVSRDLEHDHVGTEHILLGLLSVQDGVHADVLKQLGVQSDWVQTEVLNQISLGYTDDEPDDSVIEKKTGKRLTKKERVKTKKNREKKLRERRQNKLSKSKLEDTKHLTKWTYSYTEKHSYFKKKNIAAFLDENTLHEIALNLTRKRKNNVLLIGSQSLALEYMDSLGFMSHQGQLPDALIAHDFRQVVYASTAFEKEMSKQSRFLYTCHEARLVGNTSLIVKNYETISQCKSEDGLQTFGQALEDWIKIPEVRIIALTSSPPGSDFHDTDGNYFTPIALPKLSDTQIEDAVMQDAKFLEDYHLVEFEPETVTQAVETAKLKNDDSYLPSEVEVLLDLAAAKRRLDHRETDQSTLALEIEMRATFRAYHSLLTWGKFKAAAEYLAEFNRVKVARLKMGPLSKVQPKDLG